MSSNKLLACPIQLKAVQHYLKLAIDYEAREPVISYWARMYSLQSALKIDKKSPEARALLANLMDWLEKFKQSNLDNDSVSSDVAGQAVLENEANKLFVWADSNDRAAVFNKNVVKSFYTAGVLLDVCEVFGPLSEEEAAQRKYAKWKATYIHNCLKTGETPLPGPIGQDGQSSDVVVGPTVPSGGVEDLQIHVPQAPSPRPIEPDAALPPVEASSPHHTTTQSDGGYSETVASSGSSVSPVDIKLAQKFCKWADCALDYEDLPTAIENLTKALHLLKGATL